MERFVRAAGRAHRRLVIAGVAVLRYARWVRSEWLFVLLLCSCRPKREVEAVELPARSAAPGPVTDWQAELSWARARFPSIASLRTEVDLGPLLAWVPVEGARTLFLTIEDDTNRPDAHSFRCAAVEASRAEKGRAIALSIPLPEQEGAPRPSRTRRYLGGTVRADGVSVGDTGGEEWLNASGQWERRDAYATTGRSFGLFLGPVGDEAAYFRYAQVALGASCGPTEQVPCASGGSRPCNVCRRVQVDLTPAGPGRLPATRRTPPPATPGTCTEACPRTFNEDLARLRRLFEHWKTGFVLQDTPSSAQVALFRTRERCLGAQSVSQKE